MTVQIGVALSGGGARGTAHIGVLKVLEEAHVPIHRLAGTSMGGVVAACYAAGRSAEEIEQFARSLRLLDIVQRDVTGQGLIGIGKIARQIREVLGGDLTFDQLRIPLALVAVDLNAGEQVVICEGSVVEGVLATMALPPVFPPFRWRDRLLVDGGVLNPLPFDVVRELGADRVMAVQVQHVLSDWQDIEPPQGHGVEGVIRLLLFRARWTPMLHVSERSLDIMSHKLVEQRLQNAPPDLMIEIPLEGVGLFDLDAVDTCVEAGQEAARQHLADLIALCDGPPPRPWSRWWRTVRRRLCG